MAVEPPKPSEDTTQTTIRVPKAFAFKLGRVATSRGVTMCDLVASEFGGAVHELYADVIRREHAELASR